jgi:acetyl esterase/lipase
VSSVLDRTPPAPSRELRYADGDTGVVDVFGDAGPVVILLHGGFWRNAYDRTHLRHLAAALAADGLLVALPEFRRVGDPGGGMPGTLDDVVAILRRVPAMLGATPGDVVIGGHSAGGHLAVLAAIAAPEPPRRVVSLAGVLDIAAADRDRLSNHAVAALLGELSPSAEQIAGIDPMQLPLPMCEVVLVHGREDVVVPVTYSERFATRDPQVETVLLTGADHFDVVDPMASPYQVVEKVMSARG